MVVRFPFFGDNPLYVDRNNDGLVDKIWIIPGRFAIKSSQQEFYRSRDFYSNMSRFEKADADFREQIARFKPYLQK